MTTKKNNSGKNVTKEDTTLFREMMQDVTPMSYDKIEPLPPKNAPKAASVPMPPASVQCRFIEMDYLPDLAADEMLHFSRSGVQPKMLGKLKQGRYPLDGTIDLHGMTVGQAGERLHLFLDTAVSKQWRTLLLIHGRGKGSYANKPVIKQHVNRWLRDTPGVLAFCSAAQRDGGTGAVYVLLKRQRDAT